MEKSPEEGASGGRGEAEKVAFRVRRCTLSLCIYPPGRRRTRLGKAASDEWGGGGGGAVGSRKIRQETKMERW